MFRILPTIQLFKQNMADFKHLLRIADTDIDGKKAVEYGLANIKGVGVPLAHAICIIAKIDGLQKCGDLSDEQIKKLDEIARNVHKYNIPKWMYNRQKDLETGETKHLVTSEMIFAQENDIKLMRRIKCYKGSRHTRKLPVRGQRTRSNFRKNKGKVTGVSTSASKPAKKAAD